MTDYHDDPKNQVFFPVREPKRVIGRKLVDPNNKSLPLLHIPLRRPSSESHDDRIVVDSQYLARIYGNWYLGDFSEQWYGWSFNDWGTSGIQLSSIEDLYLVDLLVLDAGLDVAKIELGVD